MNTARKTHSSLVALIVAGALGAAALMADARSASADASIVASGKWQGKTYDAKGGWKIVREGDHRFLVINADFETRRGPDLKVFLSPRTADEVTGKNATKGSRKLAPLPRHRGAQRIAIPAGVTLDAYKSVLIHCEKYSVLFAASSLGPRPAR